MSTHNSQLENVSETHANASKSRVANVYDSVCVCVEREGAGDESGTLKFRKAGHTWDAARSSV